MYLLCLRKVFPKIIFTKMKVLFEYLEFRRFFFLLLKVLKNLDSFNRGGGGALPKNM